ncbi:hypothetical protein Poly30_20820 [Planctomycetes bacterium Poly30]|uniref:Uncharacterized protein n=1 Tax=Saltatorellus ferox TaxID=2528018 RepID=A0A518ER53_9BACT|nr:hypothetical protein Poly30_20820 [Planctomycetes bacterium Poly30]
MSVLCSLSLGCLSLAAPPQGPAVVFNNTAPTGLFHDISSGITVFDEGRIPSTSAPELGAQDTYSITRVELGYTTRAQAASLGGPGARVILSFYGTGDVSDDPSELGSPLAVFDVTGLPGSTATGSLSSHRVPYLLPFPVCFRADGNGRFDPSAGNDFVWSLSMPDEVNGSAGPLIAGDPQSCAKGDGTYFQAAGACGTGLGSIDGFGELTASGDYVFRDFGGYPQNAYGSFHLMAEAPLSGECSGCGIADPYLEPNDSCATALPIGLLPIFGLIAEPGDDDFFELSIPSSSTLIVDALFDGALGDLDLELYAANCGALLASSSTIGRQESLEYFVCSGAPEDVVLRVIAPTSSCLSYDLKLQATPVVDDAFEDNDICSQSALGGISTFTTRDLLVSECDSDYFLLRVADQREVRIDLFFAHSDSNVDVQLWDASCQTLLGSSTGLGDTETITSYNGTGVTVDVIAEIFCDGGKGNAEYSLSACYSIGDLISFQTCTGVSNSTGRPATMCARGSDVAADNFVLFYAVDLPAFAFGYFITSLTTDSVPRPGGATGTLCLGASGVGRYAYDVLQTSNSNAAFYQPDLRNTPTGLGPVSVMPGETRYWQFWYRDTTPSGGTTSNFTGGVGVTFQ